MPGYIFFTVYADHVIGYIIQNLNGHFFYLHLLFYMNITFIVDATIDCGKKLIGCTKRQNIKNN